MSSIDHFDLRSFDLNLLVAFDALMQQQTVTGAAARLKVGQPAMSHSLATLRVLLQDELFVRIGQTMQPTARARTLAPRIRTALEQMQAALHLSDAFDPLTEQRTFRLGFSSEMEVLLVPDLTERLRVAAPGLRLLGSLVERDKVHTMIDDGAIDLAIGCFAHAAQRHCGEHLFDPTLSCCFNPHLLPIVPPIGLDAYLATPHAVVSRNDVLQGCLDTGLRKAGVHLNVVAAGSEFMTVLAAAARSPVLVTVPARMARRFGPRFGLTVSDLPLALDIPSVAMVWSARSDRDPAAVWLREQVRACVADAEAGMKK